MGPTMPSYARTTRYIVHPGPRPVVSRVTVDRKIPFAWTLGGLALACAAFWAKLLGVL